MEAIQEQSTELIVIKKENALQVFTDEAARKPILDAVKAKIDAFVPDVSTTKGRAAIKSFAFLIAKAKNDVDKMGAEISKVQKELPKKIDNGRTAVWNFLENLQKEVRQPLDEWEAEQARIKAEEEARIEAERLAAQKETDHEAALVEHELFTLRKAEEKRLEVEAQAKRDEEIRKQAIAEAQKAAEQKLENERLASAKREAESKLREEQAEKEKVEAQERQKAQAEQAEKDKIEAAAKAERDRIAAAEQAERDRAAAEKKAEEDKSAAVEAERRRIAKIESDKEADRLAREADKTHKGNIMRQAINAIKDLGFSEKAATSIIVAIEMNVIPNVKIEF